MKIPNYDVQDNAASNYKQLFDFMPNQCFRMLICGPSASGKTHFLLDMIYRLLYFDKIYLYAKNLEQSKYQHLLKPFEPFNKEVGYDIIEASNDKILPVSELKDDNQKLIIFDDFVCEKNPKTLVDHFIRGRHKNCSVIYLSQSITKHQKIYASIVHIFVFMNFQVTMKFLRHAVKIILTRKNIKNLLKNHIVFLYIDKPRKFITKNFNEKKNTII